MRRNRPSPSSTDILTVTRTLGITRARTSQVMVVAPPLACLPLVLAVFTQSATAKMVWSATFGTLVSVGKMSDDSLDGAPLVAGITTLLRQFHTSTTRRYVDYLTQFMRAQLHTSFSSSSSRQPPEAPQEVVAMLHYLEALVRFAQIETPDLAIYQSAVGIGTS